MHFLRQNKTDPSETCKRRASKGSSSNGPVTCRGTEPGPRKNVTSITID